MKLLAVAMIAYGFLKGSMYRKSASPTGRRLGFLIAVFYVGTGLALLFVRHS